MGGQDQDDYNGLDICCTFFGNIQEIGILL
jgi:hypothetical protein